MFQFSKRLELFLLTAAPALLTLALTAIYLAPKHTGELERVMPLLPMLPVFYWGMLHIHAMPYWFLFLIGLAVDATTGLPLGLSSLLYIAFLGLLRSQRRYVHKEGFAVKWGYFSLLLLVIILAQWLCLSWFYAMFLPPTAALVQWALTAGCYPLAYLVFDAVDRWVHDRRWKILHGR